MPDQFKLCLYQMDVVIGEPEVNYRKVEELLERFAKADHRPDILVLPEMWNTGYALTEIGRLADDQGERTRSLLARFSKLCGMNIVGGSVSAKFGPDVRNTTYVFDRGGNLIQEYAKIHLFGLMDEDKHLTGGERASQFELDGEKAASIICYDLRFPELARKLAVGGAKILFVPAEWPTPRLHHWRTLLAARAIENQMYVVACNRCGRSGDTEFFGHSLVIDPWGEVIAEADESEQTMNVSLPLTEVDRVRSLIPVFQDRRPHLYL